MQCLSTLNFNILLHKGLKCDTGADNLMIIAKQRGKYAITHLTMDGDVWCYIVT